MAMQTYFVVFRGPFSQEVSGDIQKLVHQCGGFTLMVTRNGPVIAVDDSHTATIAKHPHVRHVGGVTLSPRGYAAERLQRVFAENLSRQLDPDRLGR